MPGEDIKLSALTEADTCRFFVTPMLHTAGWGKSPYSIGQQRTFTDGRIMVAGGMVRRGKQKRADYLLFYRRDFPIAIVEAKEASRPAEDGVQQVREYAEILGLKFAYAAFDGQSYEPIIEAPYRWRDWAAREDGISGDELLAFINQDSTVRPDGSTGMGLFHYLRSLAGTGGFLVESFDHLIGQVKISEDRCTLQRQSLFGQEAKPLPYMLSQMNLLLHGLEAPQIVYGNTLAQKLTNIGDRDRVDVILTNPLFGGEEEAGIKANFPADRQTAETALLFLQYIMRKLKRPGRGSERGGRAAVVVPNGKATPSTGPSTTSISRTPTAKRRWSTFPPEDLVVRMIRNEREAAALLAEIAALVGMAHNSEAFA